MALIGQYKEDTICSAWASPTELIAHCTDLEPILGELSPEVIPNALMAASDALYTLSGRVFPGLCIKTVTPENLCAGDARIPGQVNLGVWPVHNVVSLTSDGEEVDPTTYTLTGFKYLQFVGAVPMNLSATVQFGMLPPPLGKQAVLALACELLAAYLGEDSSLPQMTTSIVRQGISENLIDPNDLLKSGRTGIYTVDRFLMIYNPKNIPSPAFLISPDTMARKHTPVEYPWGYGTGNLSR